MEQSSTSAVLDSDSTRAVCCGGRWGFDEPYTAIRQCRESYGRLLVAPGIQIRSNSASMATVAEDRTNGIHGPKYNPEHMNIEDFEHSSLQTWPTPIVVGEPGHVTHPGKKYDLKGQ